MSRNPAFSRYSRTASTPIAPGKTRDGAGWSWFKSVLASASTIAFVVVVDVVALLLPLPLLLLPSPLSFSSFPFCCNKSPYECFRFDGSSEAFRNPASFLVRTSAVTKMAALSVLGALTMYMSCRRRALPIVADAHTICRVVVVVVGDVLRGGPPRRRFGVCVFAFDAFGLYSQTKASRSSCASGFVVWCSRLAVAVVVCKSRSTSSRIRVLRLFLSARATDRYKSCCRCSDVSSSSLSLLLSLSSSLLGIPSLASRICLAFRCLANRTLLCSREVVARTFLISFRNCKKSFGVPAKNVGS
mmetsp:Transcript_7462/g.16049  ORF Transcript_7462/g.16049 Transcript_7462/m.16049 type:complete len:301 (+) Transcript_7462:824-1726(+)